MMAGPADTADDQIEIVQAVRLTTEFYAWERRGRGWDVWPDAVELEPAFRPFVSAWSRAGGVADDGRKPSLLGEWLRHLVGGRTQERFAPEQIDEPEPDPALHLPVLEIQVALPPDAKVGPDAAEHFLLSLSTCEGPLGFEVLGTSESITVQMACVQADAGHVEQQLHAHFPEVVTTKANDRLAETWQAGKGIPIVVDFGLSQEFMRPLKTFSRFDADPLVGLLGSLGDLADGEVAIIQVLFQSVRFPWAESITRSVTDWQGDAFFVDAPELVAFAREKVGRPLFAAVIRTAVRTSTRDRTMGMMRRVGGALALLGSPSGNELLALSNDEYDNGEHVRDVLSRQTHRSGLLLNSQELVSVVHPPSTSVRATRLTRDHRRTRATPRNLLGHELVLGENTHNGTTVAASASLDQRLRHTHLIGASGTGKSTLLLNMIIQDLRHGLGFALIDPHGDLIDRVFAHIPENRIGDVILVDPADSESSVGFNILAAHSELEKTLLASDLVAIFRRLSTSWGDQMTSVLANAVLAFLESTQGGTLADLRRFLVEAEYRKGFLATVRDPEVVYYWQKEYPLLSGRPQASLLTRLDTFLRPKLVRRMVAQPNSLDFATIMDEGKILLVKLAQGAIGEENATLLGSLFVSKIHQLALGRQAQAETKRRPFFVYLDEFQHFVTPSMATLLTGARKYRLGLVLAHQELRQLWNQDRDVAGAVLANAAIRVCFRVGDDDAKKLEDGFASFTARDLQNLGVGQAICRVDRAESDFSLDALPPPAEVVDSLVRDRVVQASRERYGHRGNLAAREVVLRVPAAPNPKPPERRHRDESTPHIAPQPQLPEVLPGRGGAQHKYMQELIRRWGEANGWRVTIEKTILDGLGRVDVALERGDVSVACEIGCSTSQGHEFENVQKCLAAGYAHVCSVATDKKGKSKMDALLKSLSVELRERVLVTEADGLFQFLEKLGLGSAEGRDTTVAGYQVRVKFQKTDDLAGRRRSIARTIANTLRRRSGR